MYFNMIRSNEYSVFRSVCNHGIARSPATMISIALAGIVPAKNFHAVGHKEFVRWKLG